jgi:hypothetical protein
MKNRFEVSYRLVCVCRVCLFVCVGVVLGCAGVGVGGGVKERRKIKGKWKVL